MNTRMMATWSALMLLTRLAYSQSHAMNWHTVSGGGGSSGNGKYTLNSTVGQPVAGLSSGAYSTLAAGYWATEYEVVQVQGAPGLTLIRSGVNVILSWPSSSGGFTLQSAPSLTGKPNWAAVAQPVSVVGGQYQVTVPATQARQFFRLTE